MKSFSQILDIAKSVIRLESVSIAELSDKLNDDFAKAVELILSSNGRVIVAGVGKSANIASKIVATFNSTGQPAVFLHAGDAIHGDLGNIQENDVVSLDGSPMVKEILGTHTRYVGWHRKWPQPSNRYDKPSRLHP